MVLGVSPMNNYRTRRGVPPVVATNSFRDAPRTGHLARFIFKGSKMLPLPHIFEKLGCSLPFGRGNPAPTPSLLHSFTPSLLHSFTPSLLHSFTPSLLPSFPPPLTPASPRRSFALLTTDCRVVTQYVKSRDTPLLQFPAK